MNAYNPARKPCVQVLARLPALALGLVLTGDAFGGCSSGTLTLNISPISYRGGADAITPGMLIYSQPGATGQQQALFDLSSCRGTKVTVFPSAAAIPGMTYSDGKDVAPIYPTGVDGIGYVLQVANPFLGWIWFYIKPPGTVIYNNANQSSMDINVRVLFVATGRLPTGSVTIPYLRLATVSAYSTDGMELTAPGAIELASSAIYFNTASCSMTTPANQQIALPTAGYAELVASGASGSKGSSFHIGMNCNAGVALYVTITDAYNPGSTGTVLSLAPESTASGVGVQIFHNGSSTPLPYGPDASIKGNTNQWLIGSSSTATSYTIPFTASYVRTMDKFTPGSVLAKATFTFSYQ